jgi:predicted phosphodiesterase
MKTAERLDWLLKNTKPIFVDRAWKALFISDTHMGVKDEADDFQKNELLLRTTAFDYRVNGFQIFTLGDLYELWENEYLSDIVSKYPDLYTLLDAGAIRGNHDNSLVARPEAFVFQYEGTEKKILCVHGYQGDWANETGSWLGKFFVRYIWAGIGQRIFGMHDPTSATALKNLKKHEAIKKAVHQWAFDRKQTVFFGHTHLSEQDPPYYFNTGSWVGKGGQGIEVIGEDIRLKTFE